MRSRSSRLFVVLLHLVGVSTNFRSSSFLGVFHGQVHSGVGIVGVHPLSILLEPLELQASGGLGELLSLLEDAGYDVEKTVLGEPYWLQDDTDGKCLGPDGFAECGDATLWKIKRRLIRNNYNRYQNRKQTINGNNDDNLVTNQFLDIFGWGQQYEHHTKSSSNNNEDMWEYALELVDVNSLPPFSDTNIDETQHQFEEGECVISFAVAGNSKSGNLEMGACSSDEAWSWSINKRGVLKWDEKIKTPIKGRTNELAKTVLGGPLARIRQMQDMNNDVLLAGIQESTKESDTRCLWRYNETSAMTEPCDLTTAIKSHANNKRLVELSVIQYQNSAAVSPKLPRFSNQPDVDDSSDFVDRSQGQTSETDDESHLPHTKSFSTSRSTSDAHHQTKIPLGVGGYSERPHLNHINPNVNAKAAAMNKPIKSLSSPLGVGGYFESATLEQKPKMDKINILHHPISMSSHARDDTPHRPKKMPVHPYIAASKDGVYIDPRTDLKFPTDIHEYLGHERKESGRHTLTGVGLFTKTMLKIKVYSVGLYVAKRDVLADPNFVPFAGMSVEELRSSDGFYNALLNEGTADRTLFIILNMQLATETVRQSLSAEWKLLSDDHKKQLSDSSGRPRHAEERMLQTIQSEENSGRCSCGQIAPPELEADPSCCARGTEMVFTWRKNGNLELRINGRLMDTFTEPIIGKGIFYEYIRGDDPMSPDARVHFADGFPFLLGPLAHFKIPSSPTSNEEETSSQSRKGKERRSPFIKVGKFVDDMMKSTSSRASEMSSLLQGNISGGITNVGNAFNAFSKNAQNVGTEAERIRTQLVKQMSSDQLMNQFTPKQIKKNISMWQDHSTHSIVSKFPFLKKHIKSKEVLEETIKLIDFDSDSPIRTRDIFRHHIAKMLDDIKSKRPLSDEIGVIIEPTMNFTHMLFLYTVHFYLVLLLIVSVPDLHTNRLVKMRRPSASTVDSESDYEERVSGLDPTSWDQQNSKDDQIPCYVVPSNHEIPNASIKKSLSYYL